MRYAAAFAASADRAAVAAWLAGVFGDDPTVAARNLAAPLVGAGGTAWFGGCAAVDAATGDALLSGTAGATVAVSGEMGEDDPAAPALWWRARAAEAGLTRPESSPLD